MSYNSRSRRWSRDSFTLSLIYSQFSSILFVLNLFPYLRIPSLSNVFMAFTSISERRLTKAVESTFDKGKFDII